MLPDGKPCQARRNWRPATSQPELPLRIARLPKAGRPRRPSARRVAAPATPSAAMPCRLWKRRTAALVDGPATPSIVPPYNPTPLSATWSEATSPLRAAWLGGAPASSDEQRQREARTNAHRQPRPVRLRAAEPRSQRHHVLRRNARSRAAGRSSPPRTIPGSTRPPRAPRRHRQSASSCRRYSTPAFTFSSGEFGSSGWSARFCCTHDHVPGRICITPLALAEETTPLLKPLSCHATAAASDAARRVLAATPPMSAEVTWPGAGLGAASGTTCGVAGAAGAWEASGAPVGSFSTVPASSGRRFVEAVHPCKLRDGDAAAAGDPGKRVTRLNRVAAERLGRVRAHRLNRRRSAARPGRSHRAQRPPPARMESGSCSRSTTCASSGRPFAAASARVVKLLAAAIDHSVSPDCTVCGTFAPAGAEKISVAASAAKSSVRKGRKARLPSLESSYFDIPSALRARRLEGCNE